MARVRIGELLVNQGQLDPTQLDGAIAYQLRWGGRIGQAIVRLGFLSESQLLEAVGGQVGAQFVVIGERTIPAEVVALIPRRAMRARRVIALERLAEQRRGPLVVAFSDPGNLSAIDEIAFVTGFAVKPVLASEWDIDQAISRHIGGRVGLRDGEGAGIASRPASDPVTEMGSMP